MSTNAMGIHDEAQLASIAQDVPEIVRRNDCYNCLLGGCECRKGSMYEERDVATQGQRLSRRDGTYAGCRNWTYCD